MANEPKLHHFLPEAYLRRFADERGDLWVLDRKQGIVRRQSPEVTAAERELYILGEGLEFSGDPVAGLDTTSITEAGCNLPIQLRHLPDQPRPELVLKSTSRGHQQLVDQLEGLVEVSCHCATVRLRKA